MVFKVMELVIYNANLTMPNNLQNSIFIIV
jgi:hypothetical protein